MSFFKVHSDLLLLRESEGPSTGFRPGQYGALHSLAAHFVSRSDPAVISLPTGYGKTAVMVGACFLLNPQRVLVVEPSSALRTQTARVFESLDPLLSIGALRSPPSRKPNVAKVRTLLSTKGDWAKLEDTDITVTTPYCASPALEGVVSPPDSLFDLVFFDEGHHSPAKTWTALIKAFPKARHILVTATPFRADKKALPGKLVFYYSLKKASEEKAFGKVVCHPIEILDSTTKNEKDIALAKTAETIFKKDKKAGLNHRMMIRTDSVKDSTALTKLYKENTSLNVEDVSSRHSPKHIKETEERLRSGQLDGIICVNLFGEGYDFPNLKIAVLHSPHKSLVPTLQFIGRFARTNGLNTGDANFIAVASEVRLEGTSLYQTGINWSELIGNIADVKQLLAIEDYEVLQTFEPAGIPSADYDSVSPARMRLYQHIVVYKTTVAPKFEDPPPTSIAGLHVTNAWYSTDLSSYLLLTKNIHVPTWSLDENIIDAQHDVFFLTYKKESGHLFIGATRRKDQCYTSLIEHFVERQAATLSFSQARKVLVGLENQVFFNVGLRNVVPSPSSETYRTLTGSQADRTIGEGDARAYRQGHFFGQGEAEGKKEIIGASARSRVWSNRRITIPDFLRWVNILHDRLISSQPYIPKSGLDRVPAGSTLTQIPSDTVAADWDIAGFRWNPVVTVSSYSGQKSLNLVDLEFGKIDVADDRQSLSFCLNSEFGEFSYLLKLHTSRMITSKSHQHDLKIEQANGEQLEMETWLSEHRPNFYTANLNHFQGYSYFERPNTSLQQLSDESFEVIDWDDCEINIEFDESNLTRKTVHKHLEAYIQSLPNLAFVLYDHRSGEMADFIVATTDKTGSLMVILYHCKVAGGAPSGNRVNDVYELAGQTVKCLKFLSQRVLIDHIRRRAKEKPNRKFSKFLHGTLESALEEIQLRQPIEILFSIVAVQPGISKGKLKSPIIDVMAAAQDYLVKGSAGTSLKWMVSP